MRTRIITSAHLKVERAKKHIIELDNALTAFKSTKPYKIETYVNPKTPQILNYYLVEVDEVPDAISLICGDVFHNLRGALDHLAAQLVIASGNGSSVSGDKANVDIGFPIFDSAAKYVA